MAATAPSPLAPAPLSSSTTHGLSHSRFATLKAAATEIGSQVTRNRTTGLAAELAFWLFLSILPIAAVAGLLAARFATQNQNVASMIFDATPPAMRDLLNKELASVAAWNGGQVGIVAAGMFIWLASSGVHSIFDAIEIEVGVARPWVRKRLLAIGCCVLLSIGVVLVGFLFAGVTAVGHLTGRELPAVFSTVGAKIFRVVASAIIAFMLLAGVFLVGVPRGARHRMAVLPGAAIAVLLEGLLGLGYTAYIHISGTGDAYQGTLAVIGISLMSLYLLSLAILIGVEASLYIGRLRFDAKKRRFDRAHRERDIVVPGLNARHTEERTAYEEEAAQ